MLGLAAVLFVFAGCDDGGGSTTKPDQGADVGEGGQGGGPAPDREMIEDAMVDATVPCEPACDGNAICQAGTCTENPDGCSADLDCVGASRICEASRCADGCRTPEDCAADPAGPLCVAGRCGACRADDDCFPGATCTDRVCVPPDVCTSSRQCGPDAVCAEGDCGPEFSCDLDGFDCPGAFECGADGECRPLVGSALCDSDDACPIGEVCRAARPRSCGVCLDDGDCRAGQLCEAGPTGSRCVEPADCAEDNDCLGNRVCEAGRCAQARCDDDRFAPNGDLESAASLPGDQVYRDLVSCGDEWFTLELPANTIGTFVLRQRDRSADLVLTAYANTGAELARSSTNRITEAVVVGPFASARPVLIEISQVDAPAVAHFDLEVAFAERGDFCVDDAFEQGGGDDTQATGRFVRGPGDTTFAPAGGRACPGDVDWICFELQARERLSISATVTGSGRLAGELFKEDESLAEGSWTSAESENIANVQGARGTYCLRLAVEGDLVIYTLDLQAVSPEVQSICRQADVIRLAGDGTGSDQASLADDDVLSPACASPRADGGEAVYTVEVAAASLLVARATGLGAGTLGDPVLSLRRTCESANSELACATGFRSPADPALPQANPAEIRAAVEPGTYTLVVDGVAPGRRPDFRLDVEARRLAARPANDGCEDARPIELDRNGAARVNVALDQARDDVAGCLGAGGPDAVYMLDLPTTARVRVAVASQGDTFAAGAYLVARCGDVAPVACGYGFDQVVPAGNWFLVVEGSDANSRGRVEVDVQVDAFEADHANDTCAGAVRLQAGAFIDGDTRGAADDYSLVAQNRCTGYDSRGSDVAYVVDLAANERVFVQAEPTGGWDMSLYVVTDCRSLDQSCAAGHDGALTESVVFTPRAAGPHFIIVDGSNGEGGAFRLRYGPAECARDADCGARRCGPDFTCIN